MYYMISDIVDSWEKLFGRTVTEESIMQYINGLFKSPRVKKVETNGQTEEICEDSIRLTKKQIEFILERANRIQDILNKYGVQGISDLLKQIDHVSSDDIENVYNLRYEVFGIFLFDVNVVYYKVLGKETFNSSWLQDYESHCNDLNCMDF